MCIMCDTAVLHSHTPPHVAQVARLLLDARVDHQIRDKHDQTALRYAESAGHKGMIKLLRDVIDR